MYSLLDAFKGDYTQQAMHYEQRMLHLQNTFQAKLASSSPVQAVLDKQPGTKFLSTMKVSSLALLCLALGMCKVVSSKSEDVGRVLCDAMWLC